MGASGYSVFSDAQSYGHSVPCIDALTLLQAGRFSAQLAFAQLDGLSIYCARELLPREASLVVPDRTALVTLPLTRRGSLICGDEELRFGSLLLHSAAGGVWQRIPPDTEWAAILLDRHQMASVGRSLLGLQFRLSSAASHMRPPSVDLIRLTRLLRRIARMAASDPEPLAHPVVSHAFREEMLYALLSCFPG